jgi:hypothetical protein
VLRTTPLVDGLTTFLRIGDTIAAATGEYDLRKPPSHTDIARPGEDGQRAVLSIYIREIRDSGYARCSWQFDIARRVIAQYPEIHPIDPTAAAVRAPRHPEDRLAARPEGGHAIENSPARSGGRPDLGARYMTLTHNDPRLGRRRTRQREARRSHPLRRRRCGK